MAVDDDRLDDGGLPDTEQLMVCRDRATGLVAVIAIDDTTLGPAIGGIRLRPYATEAAAIAECRRLARAMSLKNAFAEVGYGGGKSVVMQSDSMADRRGAFRAFGRFVARAGGAYMPAADMGTGAEDLRAVAETAGGVLCDDADTSASTAVGVHAAIAAAVRVAGVARTLDGVTVMVQGAGSVGARLAALLARDGASVAVSDPDGDRASAVARAVSGTVVAVDEAVAAECDVFAPCAIARVVDAATVPRIRARIVAGGANDVLADPSMAAALAERGIAYVPDFVANAGGVVQFRARRDAWSPERLHEALTAIGGRAAAVLDEAERAGSTTLDVAETAAYRLLGRTRPGRAALAGEPPSGSSRAR